MSRKITQSQPDFCCLLLSARHVMSNVPESEYSSNGLILANEKSRPKHQGIYWFEWILPLHKLGCFAQERSWSQSRKWLVQTSRTVWSWPLLESQLLVCNCSGSKVSQSNLPWFKDSVRHSYARIEGSQDSIYDIRPAAIAVKHVGTTMQSSHHFSIAISLSARGDAKATLKHCAEWPASKAESHYTFIKHVKEICQYAVHHGKSAQLLRSSLPAQYQSHLFLPLASWKPAVVICSIQSHNGSQDPWGDSCR